MHFKLIRNPTGEACRAIVTLTERERYEVIAGAVPYIYSPGGLGIDRDEAIASSTIDFRGACFVDVERCLIACLAAFRVALRDAIKKRAYWRRITATMDQDEQDGFDAFPGGRFADAMRGTKSFPNHIRCPFKDPNRTQAWQRGYSNAHAALIDSFAEAAPALARARALAEARS